MFVIIIKIDSIAFLSMQAALYNYFKLISLFFNASASLILWLGFKQRKVEKFGCIK